MFVSFALVDLLCMLPLTKPAKTEANTHEKTNDERNEHHVVQYGLTPAFADSVDEYLDGSADRKLGNVKVSVDSGGDAAVFIKEFSILSLGS